MTDYQEFQLGYEVSFHICLKLSQQNSHLLLNYREFEVHLKIFRSTIHLEDVDVSEDKYVH